MSQYRRLIERRYWQRQIRKITEYEPHEKQIPVHEAIDYGATDLDLMWGRQSGKTICSADEVVIELPFGPVKNQPLRHIWIVGPEFDVTDPVFEYVWDWVVKKRCICGINPPKQSARMRYIEFPWGARISCLTTKNPDSLQGKGVVKIVGDEFADIQPGVNEQYLKPVTMHTAGVVMRISTPDGILNHFTETFNDTLEQMKAGDTAYYASHATSYDNPYASREWLAAYRRQCERTGSMDIFNQEILAQVTARSGAIFPQFTMQKDGQDWHVGHYPYIPGVPIEFGTDWGYDHPFVTLFGQIIDGDRLRIFAEISQRGLSPVDQRNVVTSKLEDIAAFEPDADTIFDFMGMMYPDPSGPASKKLFRDAGFSIFEPSSQDRIRINSVNDGIVEIRKLLSRPDIPGLEIDKSCVNLIKGIQNYVWNERAEKERPVKLADDEVDALRYLIMGALGMKAEVPIPFVL